MTLSTDARYRSVVTINEVARAGRARRTYPAIPVTRCHPRAAFVGVIRSNSRAHRPLTGWVAWTGDVPRYGIRTVCGDLLHNPKALDAEAIERFCDRCLLAGMGHQVYAFRDGSGAFLYIGQTGDLLSRVTAHSRTASWWPDVARMHHAEVAPTDALGVESELIRSLAPLHNRRPGPKGGALWQTAC